MAKNPGNWFSNAKDVLGKLLNITNDGSTVAIDSELSTTGDINTDGDLYCQGLSAVGVVLMSGLPTSDPTNAGQLWNNSGVLTVSAG
jgi:hypothetical protein